MRTAQREVSVAGALGLLLLVLAIVAPSFFQPAPLLSLAAREAPTLIVTGGIALVIVARQIDISVGSQFALCSVCAGLLLAAHWPVVVVSMGCLVFGALLGLINGLLVSGLQLPSIVVTLATMVSWREALRWERQGQFVNLPPGVQWFGFSQTTGQLVILFVALLVFLVLALASQHLGAGRFVYAIGTNADAARLAGLRPRLITCALFSLLGVLCAIAAILNAVQSPQVDPKSGTGLELKTIAAAVIGGIAISGGRGKLWGAGLGVALLACISPTLIHAHVESYWERAIQGIIILLAVLADAAPGRTGLPALARDRLNRSQSK
jgi:rhamnose transport system permease protein